MIEDSTTETYTLDGSSPSVSFETGEYVKSDPVIEVEIEDDYTDIIELSASVDNDAEIEDEPDFDSCGAGETCTVEYEIDTGSLDSGDEFDLDVDATDEVDNTGSESKEFTFDNSYDGDTSPSLDWESYEEDGIIMVDGDEELTIGYNDDEERPNEVTCYDDGDRVDSDSSSSSSDDEYQFDCRFDDDDYSGSEADLSIEACDDAGNCHEYDAGEFIFDSTAPTFIENPSAMVGIYNDDFTVDFRAFDDASGLDQVEYFFEAGTDEGDGHTVDIDDGTEEFTVNASNIEEEGQNTLYVRLKDQANRWSEMKSFNFEYDPSANPELSLDVQNSLTVTAGESKSFSVTVENTGNLMVSGAGLTAEGPGIDSTEAVDDLYPGDSTEISFEVSPGEENIGVHEMTVSSENPSTSKTVDLRVEANSDQQDSIDSDLSEYQSKLEKLESNVSSLKEKGLPGDLSSQLDSDFSSYKQKIQDAQSAADSGDYYEAQSILEDIDSSYSTATSTYNEVDQTYQENQRQKMMMFGAAGFLGLMALAGIFFWRSEEYDFNYERIIDSDIDVASLNGIDLDALKSRVSAILENEEEAEEFEWQGFN